METTPATSMFFTFFFMGSFLSLPSLITASSSNVTAVFAFGDSSIDPGNNNLVPTPARCNFPPYGLDFPNHAATGRFCNGKLPTDFLASLLGLKDLLPAYLDPELTENDLLTGVSFASAASGLDPLTSLTTRALDVSTQLKLFEEAVVRMERLVGEEKSRFILDNGIFFFSVGSPDVLINFYTTHARALQFSVSEYQDFLLQKLESAVQRLYKAGGRRFLLTGLPPIGCLPASMTVFQHECVEERNAESRAYNTKLQSLISRWQAELFKGAKIAYLDAYNPLIDMANNPNKYGFEETRKGCCGTGIYCDVAKPVCPDRTKYLFWDAFHPTEAAYSIMVNEAVKTLLPLLN
ncbi:unnamed protein product [Dovyalis caffra]|uniref:Uncharacterized protein n=1 Tax=Dovyalis caffra TaxID=77055 RepID=A0AAV1QWL5_9ROSI|nr:unnamed protein product [Dovyalis caffra]